MPRKSQSAIDQYKARRLGRDDPTRRDSGRQTEGAGRGRRLLLLTVALVAALGAWVWRALPADPVPVQLAYEIDLTRAPQGTLAITLIAEGELPDELPLAAAIGPVGTSESGVHLAAPRAVALNGDGSRREDLRVLTEPDGWRVETAGARRVGVRYEVDLSHVDGSEEDIRRHISTPVAGGVRAAGYELFLMPRQVAVQDITVMIHNPGDLPVLVPWPALVRGPHRPDTAEADADPAADPSDDLPVQRAHLGLGQGYEPALVEPAAAGGERPTAASAPVPSNLFYHPKDLSDLHNALIICGDIRSLSVQARDCVIQLATDQDWPFRDDAALDLVRRIARTELGFFGSSPSPQITVLLSANRVTARDGFDVYGVHTGSSVLVLMSPETTYGLLEERCASVIAHEMFHGWLGEAVRQTDPSTLWFTEGVTTWYSARMLTAAGLWTPEHARRTLAERLRRDWAESPLLGRISLADAAAGVMADAEQVRYAYAGGVAAAMALDQWLAVSSGLERPLDEVLRHLYMQYEGHDLSRELIERAIHEVTGVDSHDWLEAHVYGRTALPPPQQLI